MRGRGRPAQSTTDTDRNLASRERLVRAAAADGAELVVLPERLDMRGDRRVPRRRRAARRPTGDVGARLARELGSTSWPARSPSAARATSASPTPPCTSAPTARSARSTARSTCSTSRSAGPSTASPSLGGRPTRSSCRDRRRRRARPHRLLRPALPRAVPILALRGARVITVPANFTRVTGEAHWEVLLRARDREPGVRDRAGADGNLPARRDSYGNSMIVDPWGEVLARAPTEGVRGRRPRPRPPGGDPREAAEPGQPGRRRIPLAAGGTA